MREFFRGWRRKTGCVALVIACAVAATWTRSHLIADEILLFTADREHAIGSMLGCFVWRVTDKHTNVSRSFWLTTNADSLGVTAESLQTKLESQMLELQSFHPRQWVIMYWTVTTPLTLLAAWLIFWKPRQRVSSTSGDSTLRESDHA